LSDRCSNVSQTSRWRPEQQRLAEFALLNTGGSAATFDILMPRAARNGYEEPANGPATPTSNNCAFAVIGWRMRITAPNVPAIPSGIGRKYGSEALIR
jgi:hypothetical protein